MANMTPSSAGRKLLINDDSAEKLLNRNAQLQKVQGRNTLNNSALVSKAGVAPLDTPQGNALPPVMSATSKAKTFLPSALHIDPDGSKTMKLT